MWLMIDYNRSSVATLPTYLFLISPSFGASRGLCVKIVSFPQYLHLYVYIYPRRDITKTRLFKYTEIFTTKNSKFSVKNSDIFSYFCSKHRLWVSTHNLWFWAEIRKNNLYPCKSQFYYSWLSLSRPRLSRITAYLEVEIWSLTKHENLTTGKKYCGKEEK